MPKPPPMLVRQTDNPIGKITRRRGAQQGGDPMLEFRRETVMLLRKPRIYSHITESKALRMSSLKMSDEICSYEVFVQGCGYTKISHGCISS
jgi:hypothetical protein